MKINLITSFIVVLALVLIVGASVVATTGTGADLRALKLALVDIYSGAPASVVRVELKRALAERNFSGALVALERQQRIAETFGFTNYMKYELFENIDIAVRRSLATGEQAIFRDLVNNLSEIAPKLLAGVNLVSLVNQNISPQKAIRAAEQSIAALPSGELAYRSILLGELQAGNLRAVDDICLRYAIAQIGSYDAFYNSNVGFMGQGLRTLILAIEGRNIERTYSVSEGVKLGESGSATFNFDKQQEYNYLRLILPMVQGLKFQIERIIFQRSDGAVEVYPSELRIAPTYGYVLSNKEFLISAEIGEALLIHAKTDNLPTASQITLFYRIDKLPLASGIPCIKS